MLSKTNTLFLLSIFFILFILSACKKDSLLTDPSSKLEFSTDSVLFDTVFRYAGSTTKQFRIYNTHKRPMVISSIQVAGGKNSAFRINVDGISAHQFSDIEIPGNDSLYVFVQVTVNPTTSNPLLIKDSVVFTTNGNIQDIKLTAIGQDVYLHKPDHFPTNGLPPYSITGREGVDTTLPNDKPHLFFGYTVIDSDCKLTLKAGTRLYFNNRAVLWVYDKGSLIVDGTYKNEVVFQGARLEAAYKEAPGQWGKIWFSKGSRHNVINWAIIKNGMIGIQVDSVSTPNAPTVKISNTIIRNMTSAAVFGQGGRIWANNCVFANCGQYVAALTIGGIYKFEHCTFANYWNSSSRTTPLLVMTNFYVSVDKFTIPRHLDSAYFGNCILQGDQEEEIGMDSVKEAKFYYKFENCIIKTARVVSTPFNYKNVYKNGDPAFKDYSKNDYHLNSNSAAVDKGFSSSISTDLDTKVRPNPSTAVPDLGAYEFYP